LENLQNKLSFVISNLIALAGVGANVYQSKQGQKHPGMVMGTLFANGVCVWVRAVLQTSLFQASRAQILTQLWYVRDFNTCIYTACKEKTKQNNATVNVVTT
jgi:hypothetical protein